MTQCDVGHGGGEMAVFICCCFEFDEVVVMMSLGWWRISACGLRDTKCVAVGQKKRADTGIGEEIRDTSYRRVYFRSVLEDSNSLKAWGER